MISFNIFDAETFVTDSSGVLYKILEQTIHMEISGSCCYSYFLHQENESWILVNYKVPCSERISLGFFVCLFVLVLSLIV